MFVCVCIVVCKVVVTEADPNVGENSKCTFGIGVHFLVNCLATVPKRDQTSYTDELCVCVCVCLCVCVCVCGTGGGMRTF